MREHGVDAALHLVQLAQVDDDTQMPGAEAGGDFGHGRITVEQGHARTTLHQQAGTRQANPRGPAGDHGAAATEVEGLVPESRHWFNSILKNSGDQMWELACLR